MTDRFVALSLTTVASPASIGGGIPAQRHLATLAILTLEEADTSWNVHLRSATVGAGDGEGRILAWATDHLPDSGIAIGWQLAHTIVAPLLDAARDGDAEVAVPFLSKLLALVTAPAVDLALEHGGAAAPPLDEVAAANGIPLATMTAGAIESAWAFGNTRELRQHASAMAVATLRLWLAGAPSDAFPAKAAFTRWLAGEQDGGDAGQQESRA